ncbi:MAG TPA: TetR/AcrR family transcriptional regulator [Mycobacteriales bacterium]|jgi:AcrR family transcriptional regulator|nr:TetR/AcrR family transcriptional regulator [Mycobacteriales bacterium]
MAAPATRDRVLREAARLFARRGFHGTTIEDLGAACGISGPALYKHFASKDEVLARLLVGISEQLLEGGRAVVASAPDPAAAVRGLVGFHADFATSEPDLIRVQDRDLANLSAPAARRVRSLQRSYVEVWVEALRRVRPDLGPDLARIEVHALFGLLNSTPHSGSTAVTRERLVAMAARAALDTGSRAAG